MFQTTNQSSNIPEPKFLNKLLSVYIWFLLKKHHIILNLEIEKCLCESFFVVQGAHCFKVSQMPSILSSCVITEVRGSIMEGQSGGFHKWGNPKWIGFCQGKSDLEMDDDRGQPCFRTPPYGKMHENAKMKVNVGKNPGENHAWASKRTNQAVLHS